MRYCKINVSGGNMIGQALSKNNHISKLILTGNKLGESIMQVARNLSNCRVLAHLDLSACNIMD